MVPYCLEAETGQSRSKDKKAEKGLFVFKEPSNFIFKIIARKP